MVKNEMVIKANKSWHKVLAFPVSLFDAPTQKINEMKI